MNRFRLLRIVIMIAGIFIAGIATGRYSRPPVSVPSPAAQFSGGAGNMITPRVVMQVINKRVKLTPQQQREVAGLARTMIGEIARTEPETKERFDVFHRYYPRVRTLLTPEQLAPFDAMVKSHEEKMTAILQNAGR